MAAKLGWFQAMEGHQPFYNITLESNLKSKADGILKGFSLRRVKTVSKKIS